MRFGKLLNLLNRPATVLSPVRETLRLQCMCIIVVRIESLLTSFLKVRRGDHAGFVKAVQEAIDNPIGRCVLMHSSRSMLANQSEQLYPGTNAHLGGGTAAGRDGQPRLGGGSEEAGGVVSRTLRMCKAVQYPRITPQIGLIEII